MERLYLVAEAVEGVTGEEEVQLEVVRQVEEERREVVEVKHLQ